MTAPGPDPADVAAHDAKRDAIGRGMTTQSIALSLARATEECAQAFADVLFGGRHVTTAERTAQP